MYRFFALAWDCADTQSTALAGQLALRLQRAAPGWETAFAAPGVTAFHAGAQPLRHQAYPLANGAGVVFGKLFKRELDDPALDTARALTEADARRIVATRGRHLLDRFWGRYVAFICDAGSGRIRALRDPSGALPCFVTFYRGISVFFSDIEDCLSLGMLSFSINWQYVGACSAFMGLRVGATGLREVTEILQGEAADVSRNRIDIVQLWDPVEIACSQRQEDPLAAIAETQRTVRACTRAWGSAHDSILVSLSGGLDSSIILGCLARELPQARITAYNHSFEGGYDERRFARLAAQGARCELRERSIDLKAIRLEKVLRATHSVKPHFVLMDLIHADFEHQLARDTHATAVFSGSGGDHVFLQNGARYAVGDFLCTHGFRPRVWNVAREAAVVTRRSAWFQLRNGIKAARTPARWLPSATKYLNHFVSAEVLEQFAANPEFARPRVLNSLTRVPAGKRHHIEQALMPYPFYWAVAEVDSPDRLAPLFSQPLIELALRLPTWVLIHGGMDRAIERGAFQREVPTEIIRRRSKGCFDTVVRELIETNIDFVRELLLDGVLVAEGLLDRKKLESFLCGSRSGARAEYNELYVMRICTEAWLRTWQARTCRAAA
jgi:asparagine synthase (glutamine-hydrolysing)